MCTVRICLTFMPGTPCLNILIWDIICRLKENMYNGNEFTNIFFSRSWYTQSKKYVAKNTVNKCGNLYSTLSIYSSFIWETPTYIRTLCMKRNICYLYSSISPPLSLRSFFSFSFYDKIFHIFLVKIVKSAVNIEIYDVTCPKKGHTNHVNC